MSYDLDDKDLQREDWEHYNEQAFLDSILGPPLDDERINDFPIDEDSLDHFYTEDPED